MGRPVIDTLRLSEALQEAGVERARAESVARVLGDEFSNHVVARGDLDAGFERVSGELKDVHARFREVDAEFKAVRAEMTVTRSELEAKVDALGVRMDSGFEVLRGSIQALDSKFRYMMAGIGLMLAFLSTIAGLAVFQRITPNAELGPGAAAWTAPETPAPVATTAPLRPSPASP